MCSFSRRKFIKGMGACAAAATVSNVLPGSIKKAHASGRAKNLVVINLNGGVDTLAMFQPFLGSLADVRPTLYKSADSGLILPISNNLGIHRELQVVFQEFRANNVALVRRTGYNNISRSHADAQLAYARGVRDRLDTVKTGWINRLAHYYFPESPFGVFDFGGGSREVRNGEYRGTSIRSITDFDYRREATQSIQEDSFRRDTARMLFQDSVYAKAARRANQEAWDVVDNASQAIKNLDLATGYASDSFSSQLRNIETTMALPESRFFYMTRGGFDTHSNQEDSLLSSLRQVNAGLTQFIARLKAKGQWNQTIIYITSEFSRTIKENASNGTDHGMGTTGIVISPLVKGGVWGENYTDAEMRESYVGVRYNYADILSEIVREMGYDPTPVFGHQSANLGLFA